MGDGVGSTGSLKLGRLSIHSRFIVSGKEARAEPAGAESRPTPLHPCTVGHTRLPGSWVTSPPFNLLPRTKPSGSRRGYRACGLSREGPEPGQVRVSLRNQVGLAWNQVTGRNPEGCALPTPLPCTLCTSSQGSWRQPMGRPRKPLSPVVT